MMGFIFAAQIVCFVAIIFVWRKKTAEGRIAEKLNKIVDKAIRE